MSNKEALADAMKIVRKAAPGLYTLKQLYDEEWPSIRRFQAFGRWFRASVRRGDIPGIRWVRQRSDKSHEYEVVSLRPGVVTGGAKAGKPNQAPAVATSKTPGHDRPLSVQLMEGEKLGELQRTTTGNLGQNDVDRYDVINAGGEKVGSQYACRGA